MKTRIKKFLVLLLAMSMLAGCSNAGRSDDSDSLGISDTSEVQDSGTQSDTSDEVTEQIPKEPVDKYYVKYGAVGHGKSETSPAGSIEAVIDDINKSGYTSDDIISVYIMKSEGEPTDGKWSDIFLSYPKDRKYIHKAKIQYMSYSADTATISFSESELKLLGPTVFEGLNIVEDGSSAAIAADGFELSIKDCAMYRAGADNLLSAWNGTVYVSSQGGGNVQLTGTVSVGCVTVSGMLTGTVDENVTIRLADMSIGSLCIDGAQDASTDFKKNITVLADDVTIGEYKSEGKPSVKGALTLLLEGKSSISTDLVSGNIDSAGHYMICVEEEVSLVCTDTVGRFTISGAKAAYAIIESGDRVYYDNKTLKLPAGKYKVYAAEKESLIMSLLKDPTPPSGEVFIGWKDDGKGTMKAIFKPKVTADYYVLDGGTGDGRTRENPAGFIIDVIKSINSDGLVAGDTARVNVMEKDDVTSLDKGNKYPAESSFTAWAPRGANSEGINATQKHRATLLVTSYGYEGTNASMSYMAFSGQIGENANLALAGPTVFKDIKLLWPRTTADRPIYVNGNDVTFDNVKWYKTNAEYHPSAVAYSKVEPIVKAINMTMSSSNKGGEGSVLRLDSAVDNVCIQIPGDAKPAIMGLKTHSAIYLNDASIKASIVWGEKYAFSIDGGFSLVLNDFSELAIEMPSVEAGINLVTVTGGLQIINNTSKQIPAIPYNVKYDELWVISTKDCPIDITEKSGTFSVPEGIVAVATNNETGIVVTSKDGFLTLDAGEYTVKGVTESDLLAQRSMIYFNGTASDTVYIRGTKVMLPMLHDTAVKNFIGWSDGTETYKVGDAYTVPNTESVMLSEVWDGISGLVYVSESGSDENSGEDSAPVRTLAKAIELVESKTGSVKKIIILGSYKYSGALPASSHTVIYSGITSDSSALILNDESIVLSSNTAFERIKLCSTTAKSGQSFDNNGYSVRFGVDVAADVGKTIPFSMSVASDRAVEAVFDSGSFGTVKINGAQNSVSLTVSGAQVETISLTSTFTDTVSICANGGILHSVSTSGAVFEGALQVLVSGGLTVSLPKELSAPLGVWRVNADKLQGSYLELTDKVGEYKVIGDRAAVASDGRGSKYGSYDILVLGAGDYSVVFLSDIEYIQGKEAISILKDCTLDLSGITPTPIDGKVFIGWKLGEAAAAQNASYQKGDVLTACYIDYNSDTDFFVSGKDITLSPTKDLEFTIEQSASLIGQVPNVIESGALLLPTDDTWGRDMLYGSEMIVEWQWDMETRMLFTPKTYNGKMPEAVVAQGITATADGEKYIISVCEIDEDNYYTYYSVRGYIRFKDINGIERVIYSDYAQSSLYNEVIKRIESGDTNEELASIKNYVEVTRKELYMAENYDTRTLVHGYGSDGSISDANHLMYILKNGLNVREITVDTGKLEGEALQIIMFADTHLNFINQRDIDEGEIRTLSTYRGRTWNRDGASVPNINRAMEYASFFDKTVACGDLMDYFSWGCVDIVQRLIFDKDETLLAAMGNHEPAEVMQPDITELKGTNKYTLEERYERIEKIWNNDPVYHSEIISKDGKEVVKLVVMDNQNSEYTSEQYNKLKADIEDARAKGISILMFQHMPICTKNSEAVVNFAGKGDTIEKLNYQDKFAGSSTHNGEVTMSVYNLIVQNPDVIKGMFCGDAHINAYTEVFAQNSDGTFMKDGSGNQVVIPQHIVSANAYDSGYVLNISVK